MSSAPDRPNSKVRTADVGEGFFAFRDDMIAAELTRGEFDAIVDGAAPLPQFAGQQVRMIHATIGVGLIVRSITCFLLSLDAAGYAERDFDLPLDELARKAGEGPNLGMGPIRLACRGQCSIPWHARSLWQPRLAGGKNECMQVQRAVWRNSLGLKLSAALASDTPPEDGDLPRFDQTLGFDPGQYRDVITRGPRQAVASAAVRARTERSSPSAVDRTTAEPARPRDPSVEQVDGVLQSPAVQAHTAALLRQYNERVARLQARHSAELEAQRSRLEAALTAQRREVQTLRLRLLREQERNRRLQALLRGQDSSEV